MLQTNKILYNFKLKLLFKKYVLFEYYEIYDCVSAFREIQSLV